MADPMDLSRDALAERIRTRERVLVNYYASWCPYCRRFLPHYQRFAERADVDAVGADLADEEDPRWDEARVRVVPTLVLYEKGEETARLDGMPMLGITEGALDKFAARHGLEDNS